MKSFSFLLVDSEDSLLDGSVAQAYNSLSRMHSWELLVSRSFVNIHVAVHSEPCFICSDLQKSIKFITHPLKYIFHNDRFGQIVQTQISFSFFNCIIGGGGGGGGSHHREIELHCLIFN